jgi:hypothetical protein
MVTHDSTAEAYVRLALAIGQHISEYVDAYYGPFEWRQEAKEAAPRPVLDLQQEASDLAATLAADTETDQQRRDYLSKQVEAMQTVLRILHGEELSFAEQIEGVHDITATWVDEAVFEEAHHKLGELLPPGASIGERMIAAREATKIPIEQAGPLLHEIIAELRRRTRARFPLPGDESFELQLVNDQPWNAANWYLGDFRSRIDVNTDLSLYLPYLADLMAHEGYPGHHTEQSIKEERLTRGRGYIEFSTATLYAPSSVVAEGIATRSLSMVMSDDEWVAWHTDELFPRAGLDHLDAEREWAISQATQELLGVSSNVAFLLHQQGADEEEAVAYTQRYGLKSEDEARRRTGFLANRLPASHIVSYCHAGSMLDDLFTAFGDRDHWFARLLAEPVTPSQVRAWIESGSRVA